MDTATVLKVIEMIDTQKNLLINAYEDEDGHGRPTDEEHYGAMYALNELQGHLQSFIEAQLNALENQSPEC